MVNKNKDKFDINTIYIKSHLDASFDIDKIMVSEELIAKTLKAVKESENEPNKSTNIVEEDLVENTNNKENIIYIEGRRNKLRYLPMKIATVAAAVFVFAVGMYAMNNGISRKDSFTMDKSSSSPMAGNSEGAANDKVTDDNLRVESASKADNDSVEFDLTIKANKENIEIESADNGNEMEDKSDTLTNPEYNIMEESGQDSIDAKPSVLSNLYPIDNIAMSEFTIKDANNKVVATTKQTEVVNEVYKILDEYPLTKGENKTLEYIYQFDILTDEGQSYTMLIGSGIYVKTSDKSEYIYYNIDNSDELLIKVEDFISTLP